jgi:hypothetical protein
MLRTVTASRTFMAWSLAGGCFVPMVSLELACGHRLMRRGSRIPQRASCSSCKDGHDA